MMRPLTLVCLVLACASSAAMAQFGRVQRGFTFAQTNCSQCHAIGRVGESPIPEAPPFRTLHTRYPVEDLAEAFAEGITTGHPSMPQFQLDPAQSNDLIACLDSIQG
jgi:cytochrome c